MKKELEKLASKEVKPRRINKKARDKRAEKAKDWLKKYFNR